MKYRSANCSLRNSYWTLLSDKGASFANQTRNCLTLAACSVLGFFDVLGVWGLFVCDGVFLFVFGVLFFCCCLGGHVTIGIIWYIYYRFTQLVLYLVVPNVAGEGASPCGFRSGHSNAPWGLSVELMTCSWFSSLVFGLVSKSLFFY